jgi:ABC-2 type transport system ATP-binding protein
VQHGLELTAGLLHVEGRVTIDGIDVARAPERALRAVAYVPQIAPPLEAPVAEVVRVQVSLRGTSVDAVTARAKRLDLDLPAIARVRLRDLSGGMKQKLLAALALAAEAKILICDEPTANLDPTARAAFFDEIAQRPADSILVVCSHRVDEVRGLVDRVVEMRDGRVFRDDIVSARVPVPVPVPVPDLERAAPRHEWDLEPCLVGRAS